MGFPDQQKSWSVPLKVVNFLPCLHCTSFSTFQDKILQSTNDSDPVQVTNDGATILRSIGIDNPAGKILVGK